MHKSRVDPHRVVTHRLDPDYYHPQHLKDEDCLIEYGSEPLAKAGKFFVGPFGSKLPSSLYLDKGIPLFRISNIGAMQVDMDGMAYLDPQVHAGLSTSEVVPGDLLIVKASVGEKICKVPENISRANITQHIIALRPNKLIDIDYIAVFLFCEYGKRQLIRRSLGSIIQYLGVSDTKTVLLPKIDPKVQIYIGDKVRQVERLRDRSRQLIEKVNLFHSRFIPSQTDIKFNRKSCRVSATELTERLDAHFYPAEVREYQSSLNTATYPIGYLSIDTFNGQTRSNANNRFGIFQATVANLSHSFLNGPYRQVETSKTSCRYLQKHDLLICNSAHQKYYIGRDVTYFQGGVKVSPSTEVMAIRADREKIPASYLRSYLLTKIGYLQIQSTIRGISAHSYPQDVKLIQIPIPEMSDRDREIWFKCDEDMLLAGKCHDYAELLTTTAKLLFEALIEGKLSEADLKAAQEGLEKGDTTLDREILARLTLKGIDSPNEPPLFPDLDALYTALASLDETTEAAAPSTSQTAKVYDFQKPYLALASEDRATYQVAVEVPE